MKELNSLLQEEDKKKAKPAKFGEGADDQKYFDLMGEYKQLRRTDRKAADKVFKKALSRAHLAKTNYFWQKMGSDHQVLEKNGDGALFHKDLISVEIRAFTHTWHLVCLRRFDDLVASCRCYAVHRSPEIIVMAC